MKTYYRYPILILAVSVFALFVFFIADPFSAIAAPVDEPAPTVTAVFPAEAYNHAETTVTITGAGFFYW